jgi:hypothetical protein
LVISGLITKPLGKPSGLFQKLEYVVRLARQEDLLSIRALIHAVHINPLGLDWRRL